MAKFKKVAFYILTYVVALLLGSLLAGLGRQVPSLGILALSTDAIGFDPKTINLVVLELTLGLHITITVGQIIMLIICIFLAPRIVATLMK